MSEMVERVKAAIAKAAVDDIGLSDLVIVDYPAAEGHIIQVNDRTATALARAAIEAMKEQTDDMAEAGARALSNHEDFFTVENAADAWFAMIDAALKE